MKWKELLNLVRDNRYLSLACLERALQDMDNPPLFIKQVLDSYVACSYISLTNIYSCEDGFVGITGIIPNEEYTPEEIDEPCIAEIYVPIPSTEYVPASKIYDFSLKEKTR